MRQSSILSRLTWDVVLIFRTCSWLFGSKPVFQTKGYAKENADFTWTFDPGTVNFGPTSRRGNLHLEVISILHISNHALRQLRNWTTGRVKKRVSGKVSSRQILLPRCGNGIVIWIESYPHSGRVAGCIYARLLRLALPSKPTRYQWRVRISKRLS